MNDIRSFWCLKKACLCKMERCHFLSHSMFLSFQTFTYTFLTFSHFPNPLHTSCPSLPLWKQPFPFSSPLSDSSSFPILYWHSPAIVSFLWCSPVVSFLFIKSFIGLFSCLSHYYTLLILPWCSLDCLSLSLSAHLSFKWLLPVPLLYLMPFQTFP